MFKELVYHDDIAGAEVILIQNLNTMEFKLTIQSGQSALKMDINDWNHLRDRVDSMISEATSGTEIKSKQIAKSTKK